MSKRETREFRPNMDAVPSIGSMFRHFKGDLYKIQGYAWHTDFGDEPQEQLVLYRSVEKPSLATWARPIKEFYQEVKDDQGRWTKRFRLVNPRES